MIKQIAHEIISYTPIFYIMKSKYGYLKIALLFTVVVTTYGFSHWKKFVLTSDFSIGKSEISFVDNSALDLFFSCAEPGNLSVNKIKENEATLLWEDALGDSWEYYVVPDGDGTPAVFVTSTTREVTVLKDALGNNLAPNTEYDYYVRSNCGSDGYSKWIGPLSFKTFCTPLPLPYMEDFTIATVSNCWRIVDGNKDSTSPTGDNIWKYNSNAILFKGAYGVSKSDDWLISPTVTVDGTTIYQITFSYKASSSFPTSKFEVKLSTDGVDLNSFTTTLLSEDTYKNDGFEKKVLYVTGISGDINIGWHVTSGAYTNLTLDDVIIEKVDCMQPDNNIVIKNIKKDEATFSWLDSVNSNWEVIVLNLGSGVPTSSGGLVKTTSSTITKTGAGANLIPNTEYEFWIRSECGVGKKSKWMGPYYFRTLCDVQPLPFHEGFNNVESSTVDCWTVLDVNKDKNSAGRYIWKSDAAIKYEGDRSMYFDGGPSNDDWLISPVFTLDATKIYRLKYHYKANTNKNDFEVFLSNTGLLPSSFTHKLISKNDYKNDKWVAEEVFITGVGGQVNIGWHVITQSTLGNALYLDNVFLEEVECPNPINLGSKDEDKDKSTIYWEDDFSSEWEYVVQKTGGSTPKMGVGGINTKNKEVLISQDIKGNGLLSNTEYEFYVRSNCSGGKWSEWTGPFRYRTTCNIVTLPYYEGFNKKEPLFCWTIIDENRDKTATTGIWKTHNVLPFEGTHAMFFTVNDYSGTLNSSDWLISPTYIFQPAKTYRLKYYYKTGSQAHLKSDFEVLASNKGLDLKNFSHEIVKNELYTNDNFLEEKVFISNLDGEVNIAWHIKGSGFKTVYIDQVSVEEVIGCPEPLGLNVKDLEIDKATINWVDNFGATEWEYYIQEAGGVLPSSKGISTKKKENSITKDILGNNLKSNTDYEFYVRTACSDGSYSIWAGPFKFTTACDVLTMPFWEGFNSTSKTWGCWEIIDGNLDAPTPIGSNIWNLNDTTTGIFEGDKGVSFVGTNVQHNDWLVSPTFSMDTSLYVLKYRFKTSSAIAYNSSYEVLLSTGGVDVTKFTTTILSTSIHKEGGFVEKVVFFNGIKGDVNLAWHINSLGTTYMYLDDVSLKKVETCPEPYYVKIINQTASSLEIDWEQDGGVDEWEVIVVEYGEDYTEIPVKEMTVTGDSKAIITGLDDGTAYTIFVKAKCSDNKSHSDWSSSINTGTKVGGNDDCSGALVIPVNNGLSCDKKIHVSLNGSTESLVDKPICVTNMKNDIWLEFTATSSEHNIALDNMLVLSGGSWPILYAALYDSSCANLSTSSSLLCFSYASYKTNQILNNLVPGQKYYLRIGVAMLNTDYFFDLCITTTDLDPLEVLPMNKDLTAEDLVDVLIQSECSLVDNVSYKIGDGTLTGSLTTLGSFKKGKSIFPFEEGVVLSTGEIGFVEGPFKGDGLLRGGIKNRWVGDKDINDAIEDAGGGPLDEKRVTQLEFDFIPVKDSISFEYLFATNSYIKSCVYACNVGAMFAAWLIDTETGEGQNLAKVNGTDMPISNNTIRNSESSKASCASINSEYYWKHYSEGVDNPLESPIDFIGMTNAMKSETVQVIPGRKYHIKFAVIDFCTNIGHTSAVFFNAGSFDLGKLDLGKDLLIETNNAICSDGTVLIKSGIGVSGELVIDVEWFKDGVLIPGANSPNLEVSEPGVYKIKVDFPELGCSSSGAIKVEMYPAISKEVSQPDDIVVCRYSLEDVIVNLTEVENGMFTDSNRELYKTSYYESSEEAALGESSTENIHDYSLGNLPIEKSIYVRVEDVLSGCYEVFKFSIVVVAGEKPTIKEDVLVCAAYVFPDLEPNQNYFSQQGGHGIKYKEADVIDIPGDHIIYVLQRNSDEGCYEEISYKVSITEKVKADIFEDEVLDCEIYSLKPLSSNNKYFEKAGGEGDELAIGTPIRLSQTIYVYASSQDGLCSDESSFTIKYEECPIQKGISPNGDGINDFFDLSSHGVYDLKIYNRYGAEVYSYRKGYTNEWVGQDKNGNGLPDGTYYYVVLSHGKIRTGWIQINR